MPSDHVLMEALLHLPAVHDCDRTPGDFSGYRSLDGNYLTYLDDLEDIFGQVAHLLLLVPYSRVRESVAHGWACCSRW